MPEVKNKKGEVIASMPYNQTGQQQAQKMVTENPGYTINDASQRNVQTYPGGGETGYNVPMYKDGGKVSKKSNPESGATYPKPGEEGYWDYEIQPQIDREKKRKEKAKAKKDKQARDKKIKARDKKSKAKGAKKYGPHWGASDDMPGGSGRE